MVVTNRTKTRRFRGHRTYHGHHRKWRGGGSRGGRGLAGMHKHKWSYTVKYDSDHFGKDKFVKPAKNLKAINVGDLEKLIDHLGKDQKSEEKGMIKVNLEKVGYDKLLGSGHLKRSIIVEARYFSKNAQEKITKAGGRIEQI